MHLRGMWDSVLAPQKDGCSMCEVGGFTSLALTGKLWPLPPGSSLAVARHLLPPWLCLAWNPPRAGSWGHFWGRQPNESACTMAKPSPETVRALRALEPKLRGTGHPAAHWPWETPALPCASICLPILTCKTCLRRKYSTPGLTPKTVSRSK